MERGWIDEVFENTQKNMVTKAIDQAFMARWTHLLLHRLGGQILASVENESRKSYLVLA